MMDCNKAKELLIDLLYEELVGAERQAVADHLDGCPSCRREFDELRGVRSLLAQHRQDEPTEVPTAPVARPRGMWRRTFLTGAVAAAAAILIGLAVWLFQKTGSDPVLADPGPVEIERLGVSLTILSQPDNWPGGFQWPVQQRMSRWRRRRQSWPGMALVRDQRLVRRLNQGVTQVRVTGVPSGILPDTVRLRGLDHPKGLAILEQNYQYDLASPAAVLKRHVDKQITVTSDNDQAASGRLLSFDRASLVLQPDRQGPRTVDRSQVAAVSFPELPKGLLTRPTLVWELENRAARQQRFEVAYLTHGLTWRADYVLKLRPATRAQKGKAATADEFAVEDIADLVGYATVTNRSGVTYEAAQLKLMAGDVNLIKPEGALNLYIFGIKHKQGGGGGGRPEFQEKSFFEYHLYTLVRPTTLRNAETKQIELLTGHGVRLKRGYVYDPHRGNRTAARVVSELKNSEANGLGKPLPKGVLRLYAPDPTGRQTYAARTTIDHTPKDETLRLPWGHAFDIACSFTQTDYRRRGNDHNRTWRYDLRNHKDYDVTITVLVRVPRSTYAAECSRRWHVRQTGLVEINVPVRAHAAATVTFSHRYNPSRGGGLTSPHDPKK